MAEGAGAATYEPGAHKTEDEDTTAVEQLWITADPALRASLDKGAAIAEAQNFARFLVNEPGNLLTPTVLAQRAVEMATGAGLEAEVLGEDELEALKMGPCSVSRKAAWSRPC